MSEQTPTERLVVNQMHNNGGSFNVADDKREITSSQLPQPAVLPSSIDTTSSIGWLQSYGDLHVRGKYICGSPVQYTFSNSVYTYTV